MLRIMMILALILATPVVADSEDVAAQRLARWLAWRTMRSLDNCGNRSLDAAQHTAACPYRKELMGLDENNADGVPDTAGTAGRRRARILEALIRLHTRRAALTIERDYWQGQGATARVTALDAMLQQAQDQIDALRPQS